MGCNCFNCLLLIWFEAVPQLAVSFSGSKGSTPTPTAGYGASGKPSAKASLARCHHRTLPARSLQLLLSAIYAEYWLLFCVLQQLGAKLQGKTWSKSFDSPTGWDIRLGNKYNDAQKWKHYRWVALLFKYSNIRNRNLAFSTGHQELKLQLDHELILQAVLTPPKRTSRGRLSVRAVTWSFTLTARLLAK